MKQELRKEQTAFTHMVERFAGAITTEPTAPPKGKYLYNGREYSNLEDVPVMGDYMSKQLFRGVNVLYLITLKTT